MMGGREGMFKMLDMNGHSDDCGLGSRRFRTCNKSSLTELFSFSFLFFFFNLKT